MYQYRYEQYEKKEGFSFVNLLYQKTVLQDGSKIIYDYKKDFPLTDEEVLKKIPNLFTEQAVELLKDGTKVKNFNKNMAKNVSLHMLGAINKIGDEYKYNYKYELKKGYSSGDPFKPVYSFMFFTPNNDFWGLTIDTKAEKLINVDYGKITYD